MDFIKIEIFLLTFLSFEMIPSDQEEVPEPTKAAGKKGKKDRKKKKEADLEDAQKELESIAAGDDVDLADEIGKYLFDIVLF